jgi:hypothetical protein
MWEAVLTPGMEHSTRFLSYVSLFGTLTIGALPPVELLPFLKYIPAPLAPWKTRCANVRRLQRKLYFGLLRETEERLAQGRENGCFMEQVSPIRALQGPQPIADLDHICRFWRVRPNLASLASMLDT